MSETVLSVYGLKVKYPGYSHNAVDDVTFELTAGKIVALIGPNGSGKTSLIKAILGLIDHEGDVKILGKKISEVYDKIGYVPQRFSFDASFPISVYEFISLVFIKKVKNERGRVRKLLKSVDGKGLINKKLSELSGGQLQRVLLARALANKPEILILDEPESGVDVGGEQTFYDLLQYLVDKYKMTALISSHELDVVYTYAEEVICLNRKLLCSGKPKTVLSQETFEELYGRDLKFYGHTHEDHHVR